MRLNKIGGFVYMFFLFVLVLGGVLWMLIKDIDKNTVEAARKMGKGLDFLLPDGRRIVDDSIAMTVPHLVIRHVHLILKTPTGLADVIIYHKLQDGTWIKQTGRVAFGKCMGQDFAEVKESDVRDALSKHPEQFISAFGEPVIVR